MMILKIVIFAAMIFAALIPSKRALHMFQQNRYEVKRYYKWMLPNLYGSVFSSGFYLFACGAGIAAGLLLPSPLRQIVQTAVCLLIGALLLTDERRKSYIKPFVYTGRVKRQIAVQTVLSLICFALIVFNGLYMLCVPAAYLLPWIIVFFTAWITAPLEAMVRQWYLNDAKRILKENPNLIKIGITGSFGKTSTKNIMQAMISEQFNSLMTPASYNTPMGITRTIREMLKPIHQIFVCEMGADHVGEITYLMKFVQPSIGVVTSIGPQHLNTFGSQENIIREKMQEIELLPADGFGIMNYDNDMIRNYNVKNTVKCATYGIKQPDVDYRAEDIVYSPTGSSFTVVHGEERIPMETKLLGEHNILNILSAVSAARYLGVEWPVIRRAAKTMKQVEHRLELKTINGFRFIDDAFNSNPVGSAMALEVLGMMPNKRYIVTPGMIDLGPKQNEMNREFGRKMKGKADIVILVGEQQTKPIYEGLEESGFDMDQVLVVKAVREAFNFIYATADRKDTILLENDLPDAFSK